MPASITRVTRFALITRVLFVLLAGITAGSGQARECRQALVLALDVSGSVNPHEFSQQVQGLASALDAPQVRAMILNGGNAPVALAVFEWSSRNHQHIIQPWIYLDSTVALDTVILRIRSHRKVRAGLKTAMGSALNVAAGMLKMQPTCWRRTIDVSGDGKNNIGATPAQVYAVGGFDEITVNALVVGDPAAASDEGIGVSPAELRSYFEAEVIRGPGAFALVSNGYADFARAMQIKLMREISIPIFGQNGSDTLTVLRVADHRNITGGKFDQNLWSVRGISIKE